MLMYLKTNNILPRVGFCPSICPNRRDIYDRRKPCQQWLSHFSEDSQLAHELIIGQIIQRLHLEMNILGQNPSKVKHGFVAEGPHAGDMPNLHIPASGDLEQEVLNPNLSLAGMLDADWQR
jgi:hypothetical protein